MPRDVRYAALLLAVVALALPPPARADSVEDSSPALICNGRPLTPLGLDRNASGDQMYACRVLGADPAESSFTLRATLLGPDGAPTQTVDPFCSAELDSGTGLCVQTVSGAVPQSVAALTIDGTLQPDGRALPTVTVVPGGFLRPPALLPP